MSTIAQKQYINEVVGDVIVQLRRDGMPMVSVAAAMIAAAWVILRRELGEPGAHELLKQSVNNIPREDG